MKILVALFVPPLAVLLCGRLMLAIIFAVIWVISLPLLLFAGAGLLLLIPLTIAAIYIVMQHDADKRMNKLAASMQRQK